MVAVDRLDQKSFVLTREQGRDLSATIGNLLFRDLVMCLEELVANSHDADAENVRIDYDPKKNLLVVSDDGEGMDAEGLRSFYTMGDSPKKLNPISPKGRSRIGKYGIASLVLRGLTRHYVLQSFRNGVCYTAEESFGELDSDDKSIEITKINTDRKKHGVIITMDDLRFVADDRTLDVSQLWKRLAVEMPVLPDFSVFLNGGEVKPKIKVDGVEYLIDENDPVLGRVSGSLYYSQTPLKEEGGIYIKVHGRAVGGKNLELFGSSFVGFRDRIFGVVNADGLEDIIGFDRSNFLDHPKFSRLAAYLDNILRQMRQDADASNVARRGVRFKGKIDNILADVGRFVGCVLGESSYEVSFDERKAGAAARLDRGGKRLYINPRSPVVALQYIKPNSIRSALLDAAVFAMVYDSLPTEHRRNYSTLQLKAAEASAGYKDGSLADILNVEDGGGRSVVRVSPARLYDYSEVTGITGYSVSIVRDLVSSEICVYRDDRILGREVLKVIKIMKGRIPLLDAIKRVWKKDKAHDVANKLFLTKNKLDAMERRGLELPFCVENLAEGGKEQFYVVGEDDLESFGEFLDSGRVSGQGVRLADPMYAFHGFSKDGAVLAYTMRVIGEPVEDTIRRAVDSYLTFTKSIGDGEDLPEGIKINSSFSQHNCDNYVFGVYAADYISADDIAGLDKLFARQGFKRARVSNTHLKTLCIQTLSQRRKIMPLSFNVTFSETYTGLLEEMLSA